MAYVKKDWEDLPSTETPMTADDLDRIENGIEYNDQRLNGTKPMGDIVVDDINCKNMFNKGATVDGYFINASGGVTVDSSSFYGDFIEITPNIDYYISGRTSSSGIILYDSSKTFIERVYTTSANDVFKTTNTNVKYIILNGNLVDKNTLQFEIGNQATEYVPYNQPVKYKDGYVKENTTFYANDFKCRNLFDDRINNNLWVTQSGSVGIQTGSNCKKIFVKPGEKYTLSATYSGSSSGSNIIVMAIYDNNDTLLSRTATNNPLTITKVIPANASYMYVGHYVGKPETIQLEIGDEATPYTPYKNFENEEIYSYNEMRIGTWVNGKPLYRKVVDLGAFPNNTEKTVAHNIANIDVITKIYTFGRLSNGLTISLGYYDVTTPLNSITIMCNKTNVVIITKNDRSTYTGYAILEYTKTTD